MILSSASLSASESTTCICVASIRPSTCSDWLKGPKANPCAAVGALVNTSALGDMSSRSSNFSSTATWHNMFKQSSDMGILSFWCQASSTISSSIKSFSARESKAQIQDRYQYQRQCRRGNEAANYDNGERSLYFRTWASREQQRNQAERGNRGSHQHRSQATLCSLYDDFTQLHPLTF